MEKKIKIGAVCGWAVGTDWFAGQIRKIFPDAYVEAIYPGNPSCPDEAQKLLDRTSADIYLGHSLGSLWLLHHKGLIGGKTPIYLASPVLAFPKEKNLGGKISVGQLKYLKKILATGKKNFEPIINFFSTWNLSDVGELLDNLPDSESLLNGLDFLMSVSFTGPLPDNFEFIVGEQDDLLDPVALKNCIPRLIIAPQVGHNPIPLVKLFAPRIDARIKQLKEGSAEAIINAPG